MGDRKQNCKFVALEPSSPKNRSILGNGNPPKSHVKILLTVMEKIFAETLIEVWRQAFAQGSKEVVLEIERYSILRTSKRKLRQVNFRFDGKEIRGLEQNPDTKSR